MSTSVEGREGREVASSSKPWGSQAVLSKPLYVYQLPAELLQSLQLRSVDVQEVVEEGGESSKHPASLNTTASVSISSDTKENQKVTPASSIAGKAACTFCPGQPQWNDATQVRAHIRSEWHRYNSALFKRGRGDDCLDEAAFDSLVDELSSDESSQESDDDENARRETAPVDHVATLLKRLNIAKGGKEEGGSDSEDEEISSRANTTAKEPYLWFVTKPTSGLHIQQTQFGILRALFPDLENDAVPKNWHVSTLSQMQSGLLGASQVPRDVKKFKGASAASEASAMLAATFMDASGERPEEEDGDGSGESSEGEGSGDEAATATSVAASISTGISTPPVSPLRTWTIVMMGGGNFSAVVIALNPREMQLSKRKGTSERQYLILARKQIHRYTTRRKQGGAQSLQDSSGKFAKSAGAQLRRYGEQALAEEIRALLSTKVWRDAIQKSEKVWIRAGLRSARGVLWNWAGTDESPLDAMRKADRVQNLPIATRKPTTGECLRCFAELTKVRVRHDTEEEMEAKDALYRAQLENTARARQERKNLEKAKLRKDAEAREQAAAAKRKAAGEKLDEREVLKRERLTRLIDMIRKGRIENTINHLSKYEVELLNPKGWNAPSGAIEPDDVDEAMDEARRRVNVYLPLWWRYQDAREKGALLNGEDSASLTGAKAQLVPSTLLQVAAEGGHASLVSYFLVERRSDPAKAILAPPSLSTDQAKDEGTKEKEEEEEGNVSTFPHRTAYDLCSTRDARDVFRRLMAAQPDWCANWSGMEAGGARVTKALTSEMEAAREKEDQVRNKRQAMKEKARKRQEEEEVKKAHAIDVANIEKASAAAAAAASAQVSSASKNRLGGNNTAPRALQREREENLPPEMRARIEREKRARAAEARFKAMQS